MVRIAGVVVGCSLLLQELCALVVINYAMCSREFGLICLFFFFSSAANIWGSSSVGSRWSPPNTMHIIAKVMDPMQSRVLHEKCSYESEMTQPAYKNVGQQISSG